MNDTQAPPSRRPRALVETALATAIDRVGPVLFFDPDRLRSLLRQSTTDAPQEVEMILAALAEEVPQHLLAANGDDELDALLPRLVQRVMKNRKVERGPALWSVRTWAHALALPTTGLDGVAVAAPVAAPEAMDLTAVVKPRTESPSRRPPVPVPTPVPTPVVVPLSTRPPAPAPMARIEPTISAPIEAPADAPTILSIDAPTVITPPAPSAGPALDRVDELSDFVPLDEVARVDEPEPLVAAVPELVPGTLGGDAAATMAAAFDAPGEPRRDEDASPRAPAMEAPRATREPARPRFEAMQEPVPRRPGLLRPRNLVIAAIVLVVVAAAAIAAWWWPFATPGGTAASSVAGKVVLSPQPAPLSAPPSAPVSEPVITVTSPPAGPAVVTATPDPVPVQAEPATAAPAPVAVVPESKPRPQAAASAAVAASASAPAITRIDVPAVTVGMPFSIALAVDGDPRRVASFERRVLSSDATWSSEVVTTSASTLARTKSGGFMIPFRPLDRASTSTLQFVAIDRAGAHGPARRATLVVAAEAASAPAAVPSATPPGPATSECAPSACGVVVSSREIELRTGATSYETIVRLDDRTIQTITQPTRMAVGTRVRSNGDRLTAIDH